MVWIPPDKPRAFRVDRQGTAEQIPVNRHGVLLVMAGKDAVPIICVSCTNYDPGEFEDGYRLTGPWCNANVWFPTRRGTCGKYQGWRYVWNATLGVWLDRTVQTDV